MVEVEYKFEVPLNLIYQGQPVVYRGIIDLILEDSQGNLAIMDHKTCESFQSMEWLKLDEQLTSYMWALEELMRQPVRVGIYNELLKSSCPSPVELLKTGKLSTAKNKRFLPYDYLQAIKTVWAEPRGLRGIHHVFEEPAQPVLQTDDHTPQPVSSSISAMSASGRRRSASSSRRTAFRLVVRLHRLGTATDAIFVRCVFPSKMDQTLSVCSKYSIRKGPMTLLLELMWKLAVVFFKIVGHAILFFLTFGLLGIQYAIWILAKVPALVVLWKLPFRGIGFLLHANRSRPRLKSLFS